MKRLALVCPVGECAGNRLRGNAPAGKFILLAVLVMLCGYARPSHANTLFFDNFQNGLSAWNTTVGQIVTDPLNSNNKALNFTALGGGGEAFTAMSFTLTPGVTYSFSLDYLGTSSNAASYAAISTSPSFVSNGSNWVFGSTSLGNGTALLQNNNSWGYYSFTFTAPWDGSTTVWLTLEQYSGTPGTAYFDNVSLATVPLPASLLLLGPGLAGLAIIRRRLKR